MPIMEHQAESMDMTNSRLASKNGKRKKGGAQDPILETIFSRTEYMSE